MISIKKAGCHTGLKNYSNLAGLITATINLLFDSPKSNFFFDMIIDQTLDVRARQNDGLNDQTNAFNAHGNSTKVVMGKAQSVVSTLAEPLLSIAERALKTESMKTSESIELCSHNEQRCA